MSAYENVTDVCCVFLTECMVFAYQEACLKWFIMLQIHAQSKAYGDKQTKKSRLVSFSAHALLLASLSFEFIRL